jgi:predicted dienelactone hydrolase
VLRKVGKGLGILVLVLVTVVVAVVGVSAVARGQTRQIAAPTGPLSVGRIELALTDTARMDPFLNSGRPRELSVWIWYPTAKGNTAATAPYLPKAWADATNAVNGPLGVLFQDTNTVRTNSLAGAPLSGTNPPVVVFIPGLGPSVAEYTALAEDLASYGYAVVGINPTGSSSVVGFPDGHLVYSTPAGNIGETNIDAWYATAARVVGVWADDASFVVSALAKTPPAIGALDFRRIAYVGHSLGGNASFEACSRDSRCVAAVNLDGTVFSQVRSTGLKVPALILQADYEVPCGEGFCQRRKEGNNALTAAGARDIAVTGAQHYNFTDWSALYAPVLHPSGQLGSIDGARAIVITRDVVRAFVDQALRSTPASTFDETVRRYSELHAP